MPQSLSKLLVHLVFSTKDRVPCLAPEIRAELYPYMATVFSNLNCHALRIGGVEDHVHALLLLGITASVSEVVEKVKVPTSKWLKADYPQLGVFHWQNGYGAFSVGQTETEKVISYIDGQAEHQRQVTFQEEYRKFLEKYQIEYDERYVWD